MEKSEIRNTGRTPNGGVVGSKIPMEFKVERLETDSGDVIPRGEEMKEMMKRLVIVMETQKEGGKEEKEEKEKRRDWKI